MLKELFVRRGHDFAGRPFEEIYDRFRIMNNDKEFGKVFINNYPSCKKDNQMRIQLL